MSNYILSKNDSGYKLIEIEGSNELIYTDNTEQQLAMIMGEIESKSITNTMIVIEYKNNIQNFIDTKDKTIMVIVNKSIETFEYDLDLNQKEKIKNFVDKNM